MPLVLLLCEILISYILNIFIFSLFYKKHQEKKYNTTPFKMFEASLMTHFCILRLEIPWRRYITATTPIHVQD